MSSPLENCNFRVSVLEEEILRLNHQKDTMSTGPWKTKIKSLIIGGFFNFLVPRNFFIMKIFKHIATLKEIYSKHIHHIDSTTNILLYLLTIYLSINPAYIFDKFQPQTSIHIPLNISACSSRVQYLFSTCFPFDVMFIPSKMHNS